MVCRHQILFSQPKIQMNETFINHQLSQDQGDSHNCWWWKCPSFHHRGHGISFTIIITNTLSINNHHMPRWRKSSPASLTWCWSGIGGSSSAALWPLSLRWVTMASPSKPFSFWSLSLSLSRSWSITVIPTMQVNEETLEPTSKLASSTIDWCKEQVPYIEIIFTALFVDLFVCLLVFLFVIWTTPTNS